MILILGSKGMLGGALMRVFGNEAVGWDRTDVDVTEFKDLRFKVAELKPAVVINCVAFNDVDGAETHRDSAFLLNAEVPGELAKICEQLDIPLTHFSTNYVFDGEKGEYSEAEEPKPLSVYAESKYKGEQNIIKTSKKYYLVRTAVLFGQRGESELSKKSFIDIMLDKSAKADTIKAVNDEINSVTYIEDLAKSVKKLVDGEMPYGIYHITNSGQASWYDMAKEIFKITNKPINLVPVSSNKFPRAAKRPKKGVLLNTKLPPLRLWQEALAEFLNFKSQT